MEKLPSKLQEKTFSQFRTAIGMWDRRTAYGKARTPNGRIKDMAERAQQKLGSGCGGDCGEVDAISQAIKAGANLSGATVKAAQIGGRTSKGTGFLQAGTPRSMCDSCASWVPDLIK